MRSLILAVSKNPWLEAQARRRAFVRRAVRRFLPGERAEDAMVAAEGLRARGLPTVVSQLGENVASAEGAREAAEHYLGVIEELRARGLDTQVSVKPTHLGLELDPALARTLVSGLLDAAQPHGIALWLDMEESRFVDATLELYHTLLPGRARFGVCLQAYLHRTPADLEGVLEAGGRVRLVKGAYREPGHIALRGRTAVDAAFAALARRLAADPADPARPRHVAGTHDLELLERVPIAPGPDASVEVQMLYGIRTDDGEGLARSGVPVRIYISYGERWYPWYLRRLAERPANVGLLVRSLFS